MLVSHSVAMIAIISDIIVNHAKSHFTIDLQVTILAIAMVAVLVIKDMVREHQEVDAVTEIEIPLI